MSRIRIIATSDIHGCFFPYDYYNRTPMAQGMGCLKHLIDNLRDENTILIDNGDVLEGSPIMLYHYYNDREAINPMSKALNLMEYDYFNIGNHDFNYGVNELNKFLNELNMPFITSNILYEGEYIAPKYVIHEVAGKKIAIVGVVTQFIPNWESPENIKNVEFLDALDVMKRNVAEIKEANIADYIVGVYHGGFGINPITDEVMDETDENEGYLMLKEIDGLDILISGHTHRTFIGKRFGKVFTQTISEGKELAVIDIDTETNDIKADIIPVTLDADEEFLDIFRPLEESTQKWLDVKLGETNIDLEVKGEEIYNRIHKPNLISFFNLVGKEYTHSDLASNALMNDVKGLKKDITMRDLVASYVFPNTIAVKKITGKVLKEYLEQNAIFWTIRDGELSASDEYKWPRPLYYNYDMVDGVNYTIKASNPKGKRVIDLTYKGKPVTDDMEFTLAVNNYRATGGGGFEMLRKAPTVLDNRIGVIKIIADYIREHKVIDFKPNDNITIIK